MFALEAVYPQGDPAERLQAVIRELVDCIEELEHRALLAKGKLDVHRAEYAKLDDAIKAWERKCANLKREHDEARKEVMRLKLKEQS